MSNKMLELFQNDIVSYVTTALDDKHHAIKSADIFPLSVVGLMFARVSCRAGNESMGHAQWVEWVTFLDGSWVSVR